MTYGWAILVVIAAIAALAYFGVLDPARMLPERCQSTAGMDCVDKAQISSTSITIALRNNVGFTVNVTGVDGTDCTMGTAGGVAGSSDALPTAADPFVEVPVSNNEVFRVQLVCATALTSGDKYDDTIVVSYENSETGLTHDVPVDIRGRVA